MLILTRKRDDAIKIGENIVIRVMCTKRGSVKLGIEAPASVRIVRGELNEFGEIAGAADHADSHGEDMTHSDVHHDEHHEILQLDEYMHLELHDLEMVMQH